MSAKDVARCAFAVKAEKTHVQGMGYKVQLKGIEASKDWDREETWNERSSLQQQMNPTAYGIMARACEDWGEAEF